MAQDHPPTRARHLIQEAKRGTRPLTSIARDARSIQDPSFAAEALAAIAQTPNLDGNDAGRMLEDAVRLAGQTARDWRKGEVVDGLARRAATWAPKSKTAQAAAERFRKDVVTLAVSLEGEPLSKCLASVARACPPGQGAELLQHALSKGTDPAEDGKAVLTNCQAPGLSEALMHWPDAALRTRLLPYVQASDGGLSQALQNAQGLPPAQQVEVLRAVIAARNRIDELQTIAQQLPTEAEASARLLCALAARVDKLGDASQAAAWFDQAQTHLPDVATDKARQAIERNLAVGRERLGGKAKSPAAKPAATMAAAPGSLSKRHLLALVDTYEGRLSEVHLRAIGRAAPLCWAFGLDLALVGFPTDDLQKLVRLAGTETNIGEGKGYLDRLASAGRIHLVFCDQDAVPDWKQLGWAVATTPAPDPRKAVDFLAAAERARQDKADRLCLLMGLGKKGLGAAILQAAPAHLELTGQAVSLETATAMGIIAERLRQVPAL